MKVHVHHPVLFAAYIFCAFSVFSCNEKEQLTIDQLIDTANDSLIDQDLCQMEICPRRSDRDAVDTLNFCCLGNYELSPFKEGDTINRRYHHNQVKHGHWITKVLISGNETSRSFAYTSQMRWAKVEEGMYRYGKRVGYWRNYNKDGTLRDSVEYKKGELRTESGPMK
jgi:hypothetical protein